MGEWHTNNYPAWIKEISEELGLEYTVSYAWAELDISPANGISTDEWCAMMGVQRCDSIGELCEKSDVIVLLSPSNAEKHMEYAKEILPFRKRTYIDKTFAPNAEIAEEIFKLGGDCETPFFTTSALRYAKGLEALKNAENLVITGGGSNFEEYIIHIVEMGIILLNDPVLKAKVKCQGAQRICRVTTKGGKDARMLFVPQYAHGFMGVTEKGEYVQELADPDIFKKLIADILNFFENGKLPFDRNQTLEAMRMRDALLAAEQADGEWTQAQ